MSAPQNIIAIVFNFDDTLTDDSTTALLKTANIDPVDFWKKKAADLIADGWGPTPAYLKLLLDNVGPRRRLGKLTNQKLREFGSKLEFYPGIPGLFKELRQLVQEHRLSNPGIEYYVVSGGLKEVIAGSSIAKHLTGIWGCEFAEEDGQIRYIKNMVSFTEKTKYLFMINKGLHDDPSAPYAVNELRNPSERRIPFENIIYVGDGFTDVPCFSLVQHFGGTTFGVFDAKKKVDSPKKAWEGLVAPHRVMSMNAPMYRKRDDLGALLRSAVTQACLKLDLRTKQAVQR